MSSGNADQQRSTPSMVKDGSLKETRDKSDDDETGFDVEEQKNNENAKEAATVGIDEEQPSISSGATRTSQKESDKIQESVTCGETSKSAQDGQIPRESALHAVTTGGVSPQISGELLPTRIIYRRAQLDEYASMAAPTPISRQQSKRIHRHLARRTVCRKKAMIYTAVVAACVICTVLVLIVTGAAVLPDADIRTVSIYATISSMILLLCFFACSSLWLVRVSTSVLDVAAGKNDRKDSGGDDDASAATPVQEDAAD